MQVFTHKTGTMHAMLQSLSRGYHWWFAGEVPPLKIGVLAEKFADLYETDLSKLTRARRKAQGRANAVFYAHPSYVRPAFDWWILLTDGEHQARAAEPVLHDARDSKRRLTFQREYEALQLPATGSVLRQTWRLTREFEANLQVQISEAIRNRRDPRAVKEAISTYHSLPGFRGVRQQIDALRLFTNGEWQRIKAEERCPYLPPKVPPYARFKTYRTVPLEVVRDRMLAGLPPFSREMRYGDDTQKSLSSDITKVRTPR